MQQRLKRCVGGYDKTNGMRVIEYKLHPIDLCILRKIFNIAEGASDLAEADMIYCYDITIKQAKALQPYVEEILDLDRYDFVLECWEE